MGASLVVQVLANWSHVSDRAFRVLVRMAVTALDKPQNGQPAAIYHGGRELLAMSLRSDKGTERTRYRSVAKAVAELTEGGAIQHLATGWAGQNAVYRLTLGHTNADGMGGPREHPEGVPTDHPMDVPSGTKWMASETTPRNQEELLEERAEEKVGLSQTASHPPREDDAEKDPTGVVVEMFADRPPPRIGRLAEENLTGAAKRRRKAVADYRAQLASGETT